MSLGLQTIGPGRKAKPLTAELERDLDMDDISMLLEERGTKPPQIMQLRERHHALARMIAEGRTASEAAILCRYTQSRVSILKDDPAFQELVAHYRSVVNHEFVDFQAKLAALAIDAASVLHERIEDDPDKLSDALLLQVVQVGADRTGHGPSQKSEVNVKIGLAGRLQAAVQRIDAATAARDITPKEANE